MKTITTTILMLMGISTFGQTITHSVTCELSTVLDLRFKAGTSSAPILEFNDISDYTGQVAKNNQAVLEVASTKNWTVSMKAATSTFSYSGSSTDPLMPSTVLKIRNSPAARKALTDTDQAIASGNRGSWTDNQTNLRYIAVPGFNYPSGLYTIDVVYTVTNN